MQHSLFSQPQCLIGRCFCGFQGQPKLATDYFAGWASTQHSAGLLCHLVSNLAQVLRPTKHQEIANATGVGNFLSLAYRATAKLTKPPEVNQYQHIKQPSNHRQRHAILVRFSLVSVLCVTSLPEKNIHNPEVFFCPPREN